MMNESFSVRPRMYASGATSIVPRSISRDERLRVHHVEQRVVERLQVRVDLLVQRAGQEAEPFAGLHGRPGEDDARDVALLQRLDGGGHREVGLAGARPDRSRT